MTPDFDPVFLDDDQLTSCLHEMRRRGWAVAAYDVAEIMTMTDGWPNQPTEEAVRKFFDKDEIEDLMSNAVNEHVDDWIANPEDYECES